MERADLTGLDRVRVDRQWRSSGGAIVKIGTVGERYFAWHSRKGPAWVCVYERSTADIADQWLARGHWQELTPAGDFPSRSGPSPQAHA